MHDLFLVLLIFHWQPTTVVKQCRFQQQFNASFSLVGNKRSSCDLKNVDKKRCHFFIRLPDSFADEPRLWSLSHEGGRSREKGALTFLSKRDRKQCPSWQCNDAKVAALVGFFFPAWFFPLANVWLSTAPPPRPTLTCTPCSTYGGQLRSQVESWMGGFMALC